MFAQVRKVRAVQRAIAVGDRVVAPLHELLTLGVDSDDNYGEGSEDAEHDLSITTVITEDMNLTRVQEGHHGVGTNTYRDMNGNLHDVPSPYPWHDLVRDMHAREGDQLKFSPGFTDDLWYFLTVQCSVRRLITMHVLFEVLFVCAFALLNWALWLLLGKGGASSSSSSSSGEGSGNDFREDSEFADEFFSDFLLLSLATCGFGGSAGEAAFFRRNTNMSPHTRSVSVPEAILLSLQFYLHSLTLLVAVAVIFYRSFFKPTKHIVFSHACAISDGKLNLNVDPLRGYDYQIGKSAKRQRILRPENEPAAVILRPAGGGAGAGSGGRGAASASASATGTESKEKSGSNKDRAVAKVASTAAKAKNLKNRYGSSKSKQSVEDASAPKASKPKPGGASGSSKNSKGGGRSSSQPLFYPEGNTGDSPKASATSSKPPPPAEVANKLRGRGLQRRDTVHALKSAVRSSNAVTRMAFPVPPGPAAGEGGEAAAPTAPPQPPLKLFYSDSDFHKLPELTIRMALVREDLVLIQPRISLVMITKGGHSWHELEVSHPRTIAIANGQVVLNANVALQPSFTFSGLQGVLTINHTINEESPLHEKNLGLDSIGTIVASITIITSSVNTIASPIKLLKSGGSGLFGGGAENKNFYHEGGSMGTIAEVQYYTRGVEELAVSGVVGRNKTGRRSDTLDGLLASMQAEEGTRGAVAPATTATDLLRLIHPEAALQSRKTGNKPPPPPPRFETSRFIQTHEIEKLESELLQTTEALRRITYIGQMHQDSVRQQILKRRIANLQEELRFKIEQHEKWCYGDGTFRVPQVFFHAKFKEIEAVRRLNLDPDGLSSGGTNVNNSSSDGDGNGAPSAAPPAYSAGPRNRQTVRSSNTTTLLFLWILRMLEGSLWGRGLLRLGRCFGCCKQRGTRGADRVEGDGEEEHSGEVFHSETESRAWYPRITCQNVNHFDMIVRDRKKRVGGR
eukprot:g8784.t1